MSHLLFLIPISLGMGLIGLVLVRADVARSRA